MGKGNADKKEVKAWVKTEGVEGADSGATVCVEWSNGEGKYLGGYYPPGKKGDTPEWTEVGGISVRVPQEAARCSVTCYVRKGMTGTAWWDDVSVRRVHERPMRSVLVQPSYRGWILDEGPEHADLRVSFVFDDLEAGPESVRLAARLTAVYRSRDADPFERLSAGRLPVDGLSLEGAAVGVFPVHDDRAAFPDRPSGVCLGMNGRNHRKACRPPPVEAVFVTMDVSESQVLQSLGGLGSKVAVLAS